MSECVPSVLHHDDPLERIRDLERRVEELERRPIVIYPSPVTLPYYPTNTAAPWVPQPGTTITFGSAPTT